MQVYMQAYRTSDLRSNHLLADPCSNSVLYQEVAEVKNKVMGYLSLTLSLFLLLTRSYISSFIPNKIRVCLLYLKDYAAKCS